MSIDGAHADYRVAMRATILWAAATSSVAVALAIPVILVGPMIMALGLTMPISHGELASGLLISTLAGLVLFGVMRCVVLSTAEVRRSPDYPARHWWFVRRAFRETMRADLLLLASASGLTAFAIFGQGVIPDRLLDGATVIAALADAIFIYASAATVFGMNDVLRHASVVPYFPRRVGEIETYARGQSLARHVARLDAIAEELGLAPLSSFGWNDDMEGEPLAWHEASTGLATITPLLAHLEAESESGPFLWPDLPETIADLRRLAHALARAEAQGIPFSLLLLHSTATNAQEWEIRKGTCF